MRSRWVFVTSCSVAAPPSRWVGGPSPASTYAPPFPTKQTFLPRLHVCLPCESFVRIADATAISHKTKVDRPSESDRDLRLRRTAICRAVDSRGAPRKVHVKAQNTNYVGGCWLYSSSKEFNITVFLSGITS